jgi:nucleotide-binding universal stress UspA family protein
MPLIKHILFPVDYSPRCNATVPFVSEFATRLGAKVTLLHVVLPPSLVYPIDTAWTVTGPDLQELREIGYKRTLAFAQERFASVAPAVVVDAICEIGDPATVIREFASEHSVDLIMMPTHGQGRFRALLLGSVTTKVLHDAKCPVWTSAHIEDHPVSGPAALNRILCAIDLNNEAVSVLRYAQDLAEQFNVEVQLVHVLPTPEGPFKKYFNNQLSAEVMESSLQELERLQKLAGTRFASSVQSGSVSHVVRTSAEQLRAGLVVIGRGSIHAPLSTLWTNVHSVVRESPCPVFTV